MLAFQYPKKSRHAYIKEVIHRHLALTNNTIESIPACDPVTFGNTAHRRLGGAIAYVFEGFKDVILDSYITNSVLARVPLPNKAIVLGINRPNAVDVGCCG